MLTGFHIHLSIHWSLVSAACPWTFFGYCHAGMVLNEEQGSINSVPTNIEQLLTYSRVQKSIENWSVWSKMALGEVGVSPP